MKIIELLDNGNSDGHRNTDISLGDYLLTNVNNIMEWA